MVMTFCFGKCAGCLAVGHNIDAMAGRKMGARGYWMLTEGVPQQVYAKPYGIMNELCLPSPLVQSRVVNRKEQSSGLGTRNAVGKSH